MRSHFARLFISSSLLAHSNIHQSFWPTLTSIPEMYTTLIQFAVNDYVAYTFVVILNLLKSGRICPFVKNKSFAFSFSKSTKYFYKEIVRKRFIWIFLSNEILNYFQKLLTLLLVLGMREHYCMLLLWALLHIPVLW